MRRALLLLPLAALVAGCGKAPTATAPATTAAAPAAPVPPPAPTGPPQFKATLVAGGHTPLVDSPWHYAVKVTDLKGKPAPASVHVEVLSGGKIVDTIGWHGFTGTWEETIKWPNDSRGAPLVFQAQVFGPNGVKNLNYKIKVR